MNQKYKVTFSSRPDSLEAVSGTTVMEVLKAAGFFLDAPCGGRGLCGKCAVRIKTASHDWETVRACQTKIQEDIKIDLPEQERGSRILTASQSRHVPFLPPASKEVPKGLYMASIDIGTTTVAAYLLDKDTGRELANASALNPQAAYGADVISRASYALEHGFSELTGCIRRAVDRLLEDLAEKGGISVSDIGFICLVGNTCMQQLFFQYPLNALVRAPYLPYKKELVWEKASQFGIHIHPKGELIFLPVIAGFVGADTLGCVLALRPDLQEDVSLIIDIGTNGELVLGNREKLVCCSTAAGPAFEGAKIECGMRGAKGAIDHVSILQEKLSFSVIGGGTPEGICGSGLIDAVACLKKSGLLDSSGRLLTKEEALALPCPSLAEHIAEKNHMTAFLFSPSVYLTQKDVREVQLAKAAIAAGILLLEKTLGIHRQNIRQVFIAGAFGNYLDPKSACGIGLLPYELLDRIVPVGNAAGEGAKIALKNREELEETRLLSEKINFIELASLPEFQDCFIDQLEFPEESP